jgi:hypothetical protein
VVITQERIERIKNELGWEEIPLRRLEFADRWLANGGDIESLIEGFQLL